MGCTTTALKVTVMILNILCGIFGAFMLSASAYGWSNFRDCDYIIAPSAVSIVLGFLLFLTIIPGCCGPLRESETATRIYAICMWLLMCLTIIQNIVLTVDYTRLANETMDSAWPQTFHNNTVMSNIEENYACCGKFGPSDYVSSNLQIPLTCYLNQDSNTVTNLYSAGCIHRIQEEFKRAELVEVITDWVLVGLEAITAIFATILTINLRNVQRRKNFH